jgi:hypothetical protein
MLAFLASSALWLAFKGGARAVAGRAASAAAGDVRAVGSRINLQGWLGIAAALTLGVLLIAQKGETRHWQKQSAGFERLYRAEQSAFAQTVANYRAAAEKARLEDAANKVRVEGEQRQINERTSHDFQTRLADARARYAASLRGAKGAADPGSRPSAPMPGVPVAAAGSAQAAGQDGLSAPDALIATEQAIQLDELIKWAVRQHAVNVNGAGSGSSVTGGVVPERRSR